MTRARRRRRSIAGVIPAFGLFASTLYIFGCADPARESRAFPQQEATPLAHGEEQLERLCGRGRSDLVLDVFCIDKPEIRSFSDLRRAMRMSTGFEADRSYLARGGFAMTGHSTSLTTRSVSAINPRAIFVEPGTVMHELAFLSFTRGEQFAESIVLDRATGELRFYLVTFRQDCNDSAQGCVPGDLLTEAVETGWKDVDVYAEDDLVNTTLDCLTCHQPDGPSGPRILRMQELEPPWNHWFYRFTAGGRALLDDYLAAKRGESFADVPGEGVEQSNPGLLNVAVRSTGFADQPNVFVSSVIEPEVRQSAAERGGDQPRDNSVPGESSTWSELYEAFKRGEAIPAPYHDVKVTDPDKLAGMTRAYVDYLEGRLPREELPDIRDVYPDDPELLARMGFTTEPGMSGEETMLQACAQCHNSRLDQSVSRARFNVDVQSLTREQKDRAVERILLRPDDPRVMPPPRLRTLSDEAKQRLVEFLRN